MQAFLLAATVIAAVSLYLMMPREKPSLVKLGLLIGTLTVGAVFVYLMGVLAQRHDALATGHGGPAGAPVFFYLFAGIMVAGAVGVVTQPKPVYAALYFVLVSLAGAGLFVLLLAEFMAIVLIIVYAGAILVTYVFVIMLASQSATTETPAGGLPGYDRVSAEPLVAILVSFILTGSIMQLMFGQTERFFGQTADRTNPDALMVRAYQTPATGADQALLARPSEIQLLGLTLYSRYALSLELAGVLLTISLVGAVVIARKNNLEESVAGVPAIPAE